MQTTIRGGAISEKNEEDEEDMEERRLFLEESMSMQQFPNQISGRSSQQTTQRQSQKIPPYIPKITEKAVQRMLRGPKIYVEGEENLSDQEFQESIQNSPKAADIQTKQQLPGQIENLDFILNSHRQKKQSLQFDSLYYNINSQSNQKNKNSQSYLDSAAELGTSIIIGKFAVDLILNKVYDQILNKLYSEQIPNHSILRSLFLSEQVISQKDISYQPLCQKDQFIEDSEPSVPRKDFWHRAKTRIENSDQSILIKSFHPEIERSFNLNTNQILQGLKGIEESQNSQRSFANSVSVGGSTKRFKQSLIQQYNQQKSQQSMQSSGNKMKSSRNSSIFHLPLSKRQSMMTESMSQKSQYKYELINMEKPIKYDDQIENLRAYKERDMIQQEEQLKNRLEREKEYKQMQYKLRWINDLKTSQTYTYDFDGSIILQNGQFEGNSSIIQEIENKVVDHIDNSNSDDDNNIYPKRKEERLNTKSSTISKTKLKQNQNSKPNSAQNSLFDDYDQSINKKKFAKGPPKVKIRKNNDQIERTEEIGYPSQNIYEGLVLSKGVTIVQDKDVKSGPTFQEDQTSINDVTMSSIARTHKIRLSKKQYEEWKSGIKEQSERYTELDEHSQTNNNMSSLLQYPMSEIITRKKYDNKKSWLEGGSITVQNQNIYDSIVPQEQFRSYQYEKDSSYAQGNTFILKDIDNSIVSAKTDQIKSKKGLKSRKLSSNIIDEFNIQFTKNKKKEQQYVKPPSPVVNKNIFGSNTVSVQEVFDQQQKEKKISQLPKIYSPKPQPFQLGQSLGNKLKMPRSRIKQNAYQNYQFDKLPAGKIGDTLGYSINYSYNPDRPSSISSILDKMNNQSIDGKTQHY